MTFMLLVLLALVLSVVSLVVYLMRLGIRMLTLWAAVVFYQAPGTNGDVIGLAAKMFTYVVRGKR
jgi:cobalamin synthase